MPLIIYMGIKRKKDFTKNSEKLKDKDLITLTGSLSSTRPVVGGGIEPVSPPLRTCSGGTFRRICGIFRGI